MVKADIANIIYKKIGFTKKEASEAVELIFDIMKDVLSNGEDITISSFGSFHLREKKERIGRNPKTGEEITISPRRVLSFKASEKFKEKVLKTVL